MIKEIIATGKDVVEAKENARAALGVSELDDVKFEVLHAGSRGIFGIIGVKPAQVKAYIEIPDREERHSRYDRQKRNYDKNNVKSSAEAENSKNTSKSSESNSEANKNESRKKHTKKPENLEKTSKSESKPKTKVIPESELKMDLKTVEKGEDRSFDFINKVIEDIGLDATAELYSCEDGTRRIAIKGDDAHILIGHHGDTLDSLQYLANLASAKKNENGERDKSRVTLDIENYRAKREETLRALARRMAQKALRNRRSVMLEPMSAYERRIIHSEIQNIEGVSTNSVGSDNNRKIVIYLTDKKPKGIFEDDETENTNEKTTDEISVQESNENTIESSDETSSEEHSNIIDEELEIK